MLRAKTDLLQQQQNILVLNTRMMEFKYYSNVYVLLGNIATVLAGFTYTGFGGIHWFDSRNTLLVEDVQLNTYFIGFCVNTCFFIYVVVAVICIQQYGGALAIKGGVGSLTRAVDQMESEQGIITGSFVACIVFFAVAMQAAYWVIIDASLGRGFFYGPVMCGFCSLFVLGSSCVWTRACLRIYNRFYYDKEDVVHLLDTDDKANMSRRMKRERKASIKKGDVDSDDEDRPSLSSRQSINISSPEFRGVVDKNAFFRK